MRTLRFTAALSLLGLMALGTDMVFGQDYPNRPIRILAGPSGGAGDFASRLIAQGISGPLGQQVIIDNRPSDLTPEVASKAQPDGYTLLVIGNNLWTLPLLQPAPYDPVKDFSPITSAVSSPSILVVHPVLPVKSVKELIALAKARPGELNYASGGAGSANHLGAELFKSMARVNIVRIPYKGGSPAIIDVIAGEVQMMFPTAALGGPHVKSGRLRALAVTSAQQSALAPGLPTVAAAGMPGYDVTTMVGFFAPSKTPTVIITRLNREIVQLLNTRADIKQRFLDDGLEIVANSPEQFASSIKADMTRMAKVIKEAGIKSN